MSKSEDQILIERDPDDPSLNFTIINKKSLWDSNLTLRAVGLWARFVSKSNNHGFELSEILKSCKEGRDVILALIKELIDAGHALRLRFKKKNRDGKFKGTIHKYFFVEYPLTEQEKELYKQTSTNN